MRTVFLVLLLVPLAGLAQISFDPEQLDDGTGLNYFYSRIEPDGGNLWCAWSGVLPEQGTGFVKTEAIHVTLQGQLLDRVTYQQVPYDTAGIRCPGELHLLHASDGSDPFLIYHS
jgi:hypothetical protein